MIDGCTEGLAKDKWLVDKHIGHIQCIDKMIDGWINLWINDWINMTFGWINDSGKEWMKGQKRLNERNGQWVDGQMDKQTDKWMEGWLDHSDNGKGNSRIKQTLFHIFFCALFISGSYITVQSVQNPLRILSINYRQVFICTSIEIAF